MARAAERTSDGKDRLVTNEFDGRLVPGRDDCGAEQGGATPFEGKACSGGENANHEKGQDYKAWIYIHFLALGRLGLKANNRLFGE